VLYNLLIERQPQFTGSWAAGLGIGPALVLFGIGCLVSIFRRSSSAGKSLEHHQDADEET
jgi:hypothetical protein